MKKLKNSAIAVVVLLVACGQDAPFDPTADTSANGYVCANLNDLLASDHALIKRQMVSENKCYKLWSTTVNAIETINFAGTGKFTKVKFQKSDGSFPIVWIDDSQIRGGGVRLPGKH